ncbi:MAG TPA: hypothetical protein PKC42_00560, partial [Candidatus Nanoperiomorbaceae bacterium]|nr:hypothetical protein [Candidatus Nanoperiomorbaceae bacterium]HMQ96579.1 hypothetical protein [Candidatus Nanoperiomorbaceae bacterium]
FTLPAIGSKISVMEQVFEELSVEKYIKQAFGLTLEIKSTIVDKLPVGPGTTAKVFLSSKGLLFAIIVGQKNTTLGDIKKIVSRMNLRAEQLIPPHADPHYFDLIAERKFREVFPGRDNVKDSDLAFYRTLAPYNPALIQIAEVVDGTIKQYDRDAATSWRPSVKFAYRRIRTS